MQTGILFNGVLENERGAIDKISLALALKYPPLPGILSTEIVGQSCVKSSVVGNLKGFQSTPAGDTEATPDMKRHQSIAASV